MLQVLICALFMVHVAALSPVSNTRLFPSTENSPSIYLYNFKLDNALPADGYLLVNMDWYPTTLTPYFCYLIQQKIHVTCSSLDVLTMTLTFSVDILNLTQNPLLNATTTVILQVGTALLPNHSYTLQIHYINVIPTLSKVSSSIEMYAVAANGLIIQKNTVYGAVVNQPPISHTMSVLPINLLNISGSGEVMIFKAEFRLAQPITTSLSVFMFVLQYPFTFGSGATPSAFGSSLAATAPNNSLYFPPSILSYSIVSPTIFSIVFNENFVAGRSFILAITQITSPYQLFSSNLSIYSLNYNSMTPIQAYQSLYPVKTNTYTLPITLGLPFAPTFTAPISFYRSVNQAITITVTIPFPVPDQYSLRISISNAQLLFGSAQIAIQSLTYTPKYTYVSSTNLIISNMGPLAINTVLTVYLTLQMGSNPFFVVNCYIDTNAIITAFVATQYLYFGSAQGSQIQDDSFLTNIYDNLFSESFRVAYGQTSTTLTLTINPTGATSSGSFLDVYFSPSVSTAAAFNVATDCVIDSVPNSCTVVKNSTLQFLKLTLKASTAYSLSNLFAQGSSHTVTLSNLLHSRTSSPLSPYPLYVTLYKSATVNPVTYNSYHLIDVQPPRTALSGVSFLQEGDMYTATQDYSYSGFLRFVSTTPASLSYTLQQNQVFLLSLFSSYAYTAFPLVKNGEGFPCTSNVAVTCTYVQGQSFDATQITRWDQIAVQFPSNQQSSTPFHLIVPYLNNVNAGQTYVFMVGVYNQLTKDTFYYFAGVPTVRNSWVTAPTNIITTLAADMQGQAGSYRMGVQIYVYNNLISTSGATCLVLTTEWSFFQNGISTLSPTTLGLSNPTFNLNYLSPLALPLLNGIYLTVIPFVHSASLTPFTLYLDNVHMPYAYNLPTYYIYTLTANTQQISSSNSFSMVGNNYFYSTPLNSLTASCLDRTIGVANTICTFVFTTQHPLLTAGHLRLSFTGITVSTSLCTLLTSNSTSIPVACVSTSDTKNVTATIASTATFYPADTFTLTVWGIGITNSLSQSLLLQLRSATDLDVIETGTRILATTISVLQPISIQQINYTYLTPLSASTLSLTFFLPRLLYQDETLVFVMGKDLSDVNNDIDRLSITIVDHSNTALSLLYSFDANKYTIQFAFANPSLVVSGTYTMQIHGLITPASQLNGAFSIVYQRMDSTQTLLSSIIGTYPTLGTNIASNITSASYFNTEGYVQDIVFTLVNSAVSVDARVVWVVNLPSYYWSEVFIDTAYCLIDTTPIPCVRDPTTPYQVLIQSSPKRILANTPYTITLINVACPKAIYAAYTYPARYTFIGLLATSQATQYSQRALLLPEQNLFSTVAGLLQLTNILNLPSTTLYTFSSLYAVFQFKCNVNIVNGSTLFIILPQAFDNLNNVPIPANVRTTTIIGSPTASVINRRISIPITTTIAANVFFTIEFPNLAVPKTAIVVEMSTIVAFVTQGLTYTLYAASAVGSNSAPALTFINNPKYISFNHDSPIVVTAGTYSALIPITINDNSVFGSNVNINVSSAGFIFQPSQIFVPLGSTSAWFRVGADQSLLPTSYFYDAVKQQDSVSLYTITLNNNIEVTNTQVLITVPTTIYVAQGGCSPPVLIRLPQVPFHDLTISFSYDSVAAPPTFFYPNPHTTKSQLGYSPTQDNNTLSFCSASNFSLALLSLQLVLSGTNYQSYAFTPSDTIQIRLLNNYTNTTPTLVLALINQQKNFLDINITANVAGMLYYQWTILTGNPNANSIPSSNQLQLILKNGTTILQSAADYFTHVYLSDRDQRLNQVYHAGGSVTIRINSLLPQRQYTFCGYLSNVFSTLSNATCSNFSTSTWGSAIKAKLSFSKTLLSQELNNVLCFLTNYTGTNPEQMVDLHGNSCGNKVPTNLYYAYAGDTFTNEGDETVIYLLTNPSLVSDPSTLAFTNMFGGTNALSSAVLAAAITPFSIDYLSATYLATVDAYSLISTPVSLTVSYLSLTYNATNSTITVAGVRLSDFGSVYFCLVLYKQIVVTQSLVQILVRLNESPSSQQIVNCKKWSGESAEGCARVIYSGTSQTVVFNAIQPNSKYILYYLAAGEYPLRPILSTSIYSDSILTYSSAKIITVSIVLALVML